MTRAWIFQANPKLYDIDAALHNRPIIYWRVPQYTQQLEIGDRALIWRAGKQAGLIGWGVLLAEPQHYDLTRDDDPFARRELRQEQNDYYVPIRVWPAQEVSKEEVGALLPEHRIVTAPMGTVFPLNTDELATLRPLLAARGYDLERMGEEGFLPLPVLPEAELEAKKAPPTPPTMARARITPGLFLLSSSPEQPIDITIEGDALRLILVERDSLKALDETWDAVGVYLLIGAPISADAKLSVYIGKAQGLRSRIKTGHNLKDWARCLVVQRAGLHPFNASDISWLERRLIDVLIETPAVDLTNRAPPPPELVPDYKAEILERTVFATLGVLGVLGAHVT